MSKVAVVYWSQSGNTEAMANAIAEAAGTDAIEVSSFSAGSVTDYDAFAFGCPAMGAEELDPETFVEILLMFKRIMPLGKRHRSRVEPAVYHIRDSIHRLAALRAFYMYVIDIRSMQFYAFIYVFHGFLNQFFSAADALEMSAFTTPDRDRHSPVTTP